MNTDELLLALVQAITPLGVGPGKDAAGGTVTSLTEAMMGVTAGLIKLAEAVNRLADAKEPPDDRAAMFGELLADGTIDTETYDELMRDL